MSIELISSPPAGGKTNFCIRQIQSIREKDPLAQIRVIVPDQLQISYWKRTLSHRGQGALGFIGTEISTFRKYAIELLSDAKDTPGVISARLNRFCVRKAMDCVRDTAYFTPILDKEGLRQELERTFTELQKYGISPNDFAQANPENPRVQDTAKIYRAYLDLLSGQNWENSAGVLFTAARLLAAGKLTLKQAPLLIVDGFDGFTPDQLVLIQALESSFTRIILTLPGRKDSQCLTDLKCQEELKKVRAALQPRELVLPAVPRTGSRFQLAERIFGPETPMPLPPQEDVLMLTASTQSDEAREVLREIKRAVLTRGIGPGECAVYVPDMAAYRPLLEQYGREFGVPLRFSGLGALEQLPAAAVLRQLLHLWEDDFLVPDLLRVLRSPYLRGCPDPEERGEANSFEQDIAALENLSRSRPVLKGRQEWSRALRYYASIGNNEEQNEDDSRKRLRLSGAKATRVERSLCAFFDALTPPEGLRSRKVWTEWLRGLLKHLNYFELANTAEENGGEAILREALEILFQRMLSCEERLKQAPLDYAGFLREFEQDLCAEAVCAGSHNFNEVFVGNIFRAGGSRCRFAALLGFAEGLFPASAREELVLTGELRQKLGLPRRNTDPGSLIVSAITRPDDFLLISRPAKTDTGEEWKPSIYWTTLQKWVNPARQVTIRGDIQIMCNSEQEPTTPASPDELAFRISAGKAAFPKKLSPDMDESLQIKLERSVKAAELQQRQMKGDYGSASAAAKEIPEVFSCSAIETWLNCPFRYFLEKVLELEETEEPSAGLTIQQRGILIHQILQMTFQPGIALNDRDVLRIAAENAMGNCFRDAPRRLGFQPSVLWKYEQARMRAMILDTLDGMFACEKIPMGPEWRCIGTEYKFGYDGSAPLVLPTASGDLKLHGIIDRLDKSQNGELRAIDYKTSGVNSLGGDGKIQTAVYAAAAVKALGRAAYGSGYYWSVPDAETKAKSVGTYDAETETISCQDELDRFSQGITLEKFPAVCEDKSCPAYCPGAVWCRNYHRR